MTATAVETAPRAEPAAIRTTVGKKMLVAASGILFIGFVAAHMIGNLKVFLGPDAINRYGEFLRDMGEPVFPRSFLLWCLRTLLFVGLIVHVALTIHLARRSRAARDVRYQHPAVVDANYASRTMRWGGLVIFLFLVFHLMDFTWGVHPDYVRGDVYDNLVSGFTRVPVVIVYLFAMVALGMHLYHGTWSTFQTLGVNRARWDRSIRALALGLGLVIPIGYSIVPLAVLFRIVD
jgi:succinate dehydrogenase / fumarate reductase cytochrome b subunit